MSPVNGVIRSSILLPLYTALLSANHLWNFLLHAKAVHRLSFSFLILSPGKALLRLKMKSHLESPLTYSTTYGPQI